MIKVHCVSDGKLATDDTNKCNLCGFESSVETVCCQTKLCEWHVRDEGEHADQPYYSCIVCETTNDVICDNGQLGYTINYNTVYCEKHNTMTFCEKCESYICDKHSDHECYPLIEIPEPNLD